MAVSSSRLSQWGLGSLTFWQSVLSSMASFALLIGLIECLGFVMNMVAANRYVSFFLLVLFYGFGLIPMLQKIPILPVHLAAMDKFYSGAFALGSGTSGASMPVGC